MAERGRAVHGQAQPGLRALWRLRPAHEAGRMVRPRMSLVARLLLDLGRVKQGGDDSGRADAHGDARLYELRASLFVRVIPVVLGHFKLLAASSMKAAR